MSDDEIAKGLEVIWKKQIKKKDNQIFAKTINTVLKKYNIEDKINHTHLIRVKIPKADIISLSYFNKNNNDKNKLAKIVENYIWDVVDNDTYLYHFTTEKNAKSIELSNTLRLYNIYKRYEEGEIKDFLKDFNIPYKIDENYKTIFYSSFTTVIPSLLDTHIINEFRNFTGDFGARLKFKLIRKDKNLRYINYDKKSLI